MKATYAESNWDYLPAIEHTDGRREVLYGDPLPNRRVAEKYAQIEINRRRQNKQSAQQHAEEK